MLGVKIKMNTLLKVENLKTSFFTKSGEVEAIRGIDFTIGHGEIVGLVGESGSGKSVTAKSIMGLIKEPGKIIDGKIIFKDKDLAQLSKAEMSKVNGNEIAMIFQDPLSSLNPVFTIGDQLGDVIRKNKKLSRKEVQDIMIAQLKRVGIPSPEERIQNYPHEFSGGQRQRIMIAMALCCEPDFLIADEPTTALDVTIQAQILELLKSIRDYEQKSILLITHDLGVVAEVCDRVVVMYGGHIMEEGDVFDIFDKAKHPYTIGLLQSIPKLDREKEDRLKAIEGYAPSLINPPPGCPFAPRCSLATEKCHKELPEMKSYGNQQARCWQIEVNE